MSVLFHICYVEMSSHSNCFRDMAVSWEGNEEDMIDLRGVETELENQKLCSNYWFYDYMWCVVGEAGLSLFFEAALREGGLRVGHNGSCVSSKCASYTLQIHEHTDTAPAHEKHWQITHTWMGRVSYQRCASRHLVALWNGAVQRVKSGETTVSGRCGPYAHRE